MVVSEGLTIRQSSFQCALSQHLATSFQRLSFDAEILQLAHGDCIAVVEGVVSVEVNPDLIMH